MRKGILNHLLQCTNHHDLSQLGKLRAFLAVLVANWESERSAFGDG